MPLFEVAVIDHPTKKEAEEGKTDSLIVPPTPVMAKDAQSAALIAVMDGAMEKVKSVGDKTRLEVLVRPFSG